MQVMLESSEALTLIYQILLPFLFLENQHFNLLLNELIQQDRDIAKLMRMNNLELIDCESIYNLNLNKQSLESDIKGAQILNFILRTGF